LAGAGGNCGIHGDEENDMKHGTSGSAGSSGSHAALAVFAALALATTLVAQDMKVDLSKETVGKPPVTFEPQMGTWVVAQDGPDKVIKVDGEAFKAALSTPERLLLDTARKLYGTTNEELMDNAKQFTMFPIAVMKASPTFSNGTIRVKFKTIAGNADRASGILFNVKPNGDWLCARYNDTDRNMGLWEFHNGVRRLIKFSDRATPVILERDVWHDLKLTVADASVKVWINERLAIDYTLGTAPGPGRNGAAPNPDLIPANNPVLQPPVNGKIGLWSKTDSTVEFKDYAISGAK
jgi:hypothetical protein